MAENKYSIKSIYMEAIPYNHVETWREPRFAMLDS